MSRTPKSPVRMVLFASLAGLPVVGACRRAAPEPAGVTAEAACSGETWELSAEGATGWVGVQQYYILDEQGGTVTTRMRVCSENSEDRCRRAVVSACEARAEALGLDEDSADCYDAVDAADPRAIDPC